jgi:hypothetical protein
MTTIAAESLVRCELEPAQRKALVSRALFATCVEIAGQTMEIRFDDHLSRDLFARRYRDHRTHGDAAFIYYVSADANGRYFWSDVSPVWCWPDPSLSPDAVVFLADAAAISALIRSDPNLVSLHAAAVSHVGRAAGIVGESESGKTTTAFACASRGMQWYSDERLLLRGRSVMPFLRACNIRSGGAQLLGLDVEALRELSIAEYFGRGAVERPSPLCAIFVISGRAARAAVSRMERLAALPFLFHTMDSREPDFRRMAQLVQVLEEIPSFSLKLGTPDETVSAIASALESL